MNQSYLTFNTCDCHNPRQEHNNDEFAFIKTDKTCNPLYPFLIQIQPGIFILSKPEIFDLLPELKSSYFIKCKYQDQIGYIIYDSFRASYTCYYQDIASDIYNRYSDIDSDINEWKFNDLNHGNRFNTLFFFNVGGIMMEYDYSEITDRSLPMNNKYCIYWTKSTQDNDMLLVIDYHIHNHSVTRPRAYSLAIEYCIHKYYLDL